MKGMVEEIFYFVIMILAIFGLFVFFSIQRGTKGVEVSKVVEERTLTEDLNGVTTGMYNNKLLFVEKSYLEVAIDSILQEPVPKKQRDKVWYGTGIGELNLTEVLPPFVKGYSEGRLMVVVSTPNGTSTYGSNSGSDVIYSYQMPIPVPEEKVGMLTVLFG